MQSVMYPVERTTIEDFADKHDLIMEVHERGQAFQNAKFYARFRRCEILDGRILIGAFGNGSTPENAIADYAKEISGKYLVFDAYDKAKRREIFAPVLYWP